MSRIDVILIFLICLVGATSTSHSQQASVPLNRLWVLECERIALRNDSNEIHLGEKPTILRSTFGASEFQWVESKRDFKKIGAKIFRDHAVDIRGEDYRIIVDPLFDITVGRDIADTGGFQSANLIFNQRGIQLLGDIGSKFSFQSSFYETQTLAPDYLRSMHNASGVYPSYGRTKTFGKNGFDFGMATSLLTFAPHRSVALQVGQGRQFYGHGYRSLLWSDASFVYPFAKASVSLWKGKIRYSTMYAELRTLERLPKGEVPEALFKPKSASVHYLSIIPHSDIEIGIFESTIWNRFDSSGIHPPSLYAAVPVIGLHSSLEGLDAKNNSMLGVNLRFSPFKKIKLYGQLAMDQGSLSRAGWQAGMQFFDLALTGLHAQLEYNYTPDFFYASRYDLQSVSHANQPMGHPGGGALREQVANINYRKKRWMGEVRINRMKQKAGAQSNFNADPSITIDPSTVSVNRELYQATASLSWIVQPHTCTALSMGVTWRQDEMAHDDHPLFSTETRYIWIGLKSNLMNHYSDF